MAPSTNPDFPHFNILDSDQFSLSDLEFFLRKTRHLEVLQERG